MPTKEKKFKKKDSLKIKIKGWKGRNVRVLDTDAEGDYNSYFVQDRVSGQTTWIGEDDADIIEKKKKKK